MMHFGGRGHNRGGFGHRPSFGGGKGPGGGGGGKSFGRGIGKGSFMAGKGPRPGLQGLQVPDDYAVGNEASQAGMGPRPDYSAQIAMLRQTTQTSNDNQGALERAYQAQVAASAVFNACEVGMPITAGGETEQSQTGDYSAAEVYVMQLVSRASQGETLTGEEMSFLTQLREAQAAASGEPVPEKTPPAGAGAGAYDFAAHAALAASNKEVTDTSEPTKLPGLPQKPVVEEHIFNEPIEEMAARVEKLLAPELSSPPLSKASALAPKSSSNPAADAALSKAGMWKAASPAKPAESDSTSAESARAAVLAKLKGGFNSLALKKQEVEEQAKALKEHEAKMQEEQEPLWKRMLKEQAPQMLEPEPKKPEPEPKKPEPKEPQKIDKDPITGEALTSEESAFLERLQTEQAVKRQALSQQMAEKAALIDRLGNDGGRTDWSNVLLKAKLIKQTNELKEAAKIEDEKKKQEVEMKKKPPGPVPAFRNSFVMQRAGTPVSTLMKRMYQPLSDEAAAAAAAASFDDDIPAAAADPPAMKPPADPPVADATSSTAATDESAAKHEDTAKEEVAEPSGETQTPAEDSKAKEKDDAAEGEKDAEGEKAADAAEEPDGAAEDAAADKAETASPGKSISLRPNSAARAEEGKRHRGEGRGDGRGDGRGEGRGDGRAEGRGEGRGDARAEGRGEARNRRRRNDQGEDGQDDAPADADEYQQEEPQESTGRGGRRERDAQPRNSRRDADAEREPHARGARRDAVREGGHRGSYREAEGQDGGRARRRDSNAEQPQQSSHRHREMGKRDAERADYYEEEYDTRVERQQGSRRRRGDGHEEGYAETAKDNRGSHRHRGGANEEAHEPRSQRPRTSRADVYEEPYEHGSHGREGRGHHGESAQQPSHGSRHKGGDQQAQGEAAERPRRREAAAAAAQGEAAERPRRREAAGSAQGEAAERPRRRDRDAVAKEPEQRGEQKEASAGGADGGKSRRRRREEGAEVPPAADSAAKDDPEAAAASSAPAPAAGDEDSRSSSPSVRPLKKRAGGFDVIEKSATSITDAYRAEAAAAATGKPVSVLLPGSDGSWSFRSALPPGTAGMNAQKKFCMRWFIGQCVEGLTCPLTHATSSEDRQEGFAKFMNLKTIPCKFGSRCHNVTCMYQHPGQQHPGGPQMAQLSQATPAQVAQLMLGSSAGVS